MNKPPIIARWILSVTNRKSNREIVLGDFEEFYEEIYSKRGVFIAYVWFYLHALKSIPSFIKTTFYWGIIMIKNYMLIGFRNIKKYKAYSFINILGLSVGIASCILIMMYVKHELSYDNFHEKADRIYRLVNEFHLSGTVRNLVTTPGPIGETFAKILPEVEASTRITNFAGNNEVIIKSEENSFEDTGLYCADSNFFDLFNYKFIYGDPKTSLTSPATVVINSKIAQKLFGDINPVGMTIGLSLGRLNRDFKVSGVIDDTIGESHFKFNYLFPMSTLVGLLRSETFENWLWFPHYTYLLLNKDVDKDHLIEKMQDVFRDNAGDYADQYNAKLFFQLQNIRDIHLTSHLDRELQPNGDIKYIYYFSLIALIILVIASINFINLITASSANRAKEVGIRKVIGGLRKQIMAQFIGEAALMAIISIICSLLITIIALPYFNNLTDLHLSLNEIFQSTVIFGIIIMGILTGIGAGSYPALVISAFSPVTSLKGNISRGTKNPIFRKILVITQFTISTALITGTIIILKQIQYMKDYNLGFNREQVVVVRVKDFSNFRNNTTIKSTLMNNPNIIDASFSTNIPGRVLSGMTAYLPEGRDENETIMCRNIAVDFNYFKTYDIKTKTGRLFQEALSTDSTDVYVINETAAKVFGKGDNIVGTRVRNITRETAGGIVIGVVKDFHHESLKQEVAPIVFNVLRQGGPYLSLKLRTTDIANTLSFVKEKWVEIEPSRTMDYYFLDEYFDNLYNSEERLSDIFVTFSFMGILIACLGLLGLVSFATLQRTKEIGIRKTMGASIWKIYLLLSMEFLTLVIVSNLIAIPIAWYTMRSWLDNFPIRTDITVDTFFISGIIGLIIAVVTITYRVLKAASVNPVESLRTE